MASSVNVLCPNGHRVTVKVTPTTSVLHIVEEVCKKKGFDANQFAIKRFVDCGQLVFWVWEVGIKRQSRHSVLLCCHDGWITSLKQNKGDTRLQ